MSVQTIDANVKIKNKFENKSNSTCYFNIWNFKITKYRPFYTFGRSKFWPPPVTHTTYIVIDKNFYKSNWIQYSICYIYRNVDSDMQHILLEYLLYKRIRNKYEYVSPSLPYRLHVETNIVQLLDRPRWYWKYWSCLLFYSKLFLDLWSFQVNGSLFIWCIHLWFGGGKKREWIRIIIRSIRFKVTSV